MHRLSIGVLQEAVTESESRHFWTWFQSVYFNKKAASGETAWGLERFLDFARNDGAGDFVQSRYISRINRVRIASFFGKIPERFAVVKNQNSERGLKDSLGRLWGSRIRWVSRPRI